MILHHSPLCMYKFDNNPVFSKYCISIVTVINILLFGLENLNLNLNPIASELR